MGVSNARLPEDRLSEARCHQSLAGGLWLHGNASIFEKIDACDELDGNTLLELCKGGRAKMVRGIYQTAKHHQEMLDTFRRGDLMAQGMMRAWGHFSEVPREKGHRCRGVVRHARLCRLLRGYSNNFSKMSGTARNGKVAEVKPLIDSLLNTASVNGAIKWTLHPKLGLAWSAICKEFLESA